MTTNMRYDLIEDISCRNDVLSLAISPALRLAAGVWTTSVAGSVSHAQFESLSCAVGNLSTNWPDWETWLIAGHKTLQPSNRITKHNGLWKSLQKAGVNIPQGDFISESVIESESGLRAFGAVRFDYGQIKGVQAVLAAAQGAIVLMPKSQARNTVSLLVQKGWPMTNTKPPEEIIEAVCAQSGLVMNIYGDFDDPDVSVAAIGKKEVLLEFEP